jgi:hypothetical protein
MPERRCRYRQDKVSHVYSARLRWSGNEEVFTCDVNPQHDGPAEFIDLVQRA